MKKMATVESIEYKILLIRGQKVIIDRDLAEMYGVTTKVLNQAVKRNRDRFPKDFMFQLTKKEKTEVVTDCDHLKNIKFSPQMPYVFTEQGVAMLSSVLKSKRAVQVNIRIMRAFVKLRQMIITHKDFALKLADLERKTELHAENIQTIFTALRQLMLPPAESKKKIGF